MLQATPPKAQSRAPLADRILASVLVLAAAVATTAAIDLVLPAVPALPSLIGGDPQAAQYVIAAYMGGSTLGMIAFGSFAHKFDARILLAWSLVAFALLSAAAAMTTNIWALNFVRVLQGVASAGAAVLPAPMLRKLFNETGAVRALSLASSFQSLVPGLAPLMGAWLLQVAGWQASFVITGTLAAIIGIIMLARPALLPFDASEPDRLQRGGYAALLRNKPFIRYGFSHALILGGLLTFIFGAPYVMAEKMNGSVGSFVVFQMVMVAVYIVVANLGGIFVNRIGAEKLFVTGTVLTALSAIALLAYALLGGSDATMLLPIMLPTMAGLGLRGGIGFLKAIAASVPDDARGSAALMLAVTALPSIGTALLAPFIQFGLPALAIAFAASVLPGAILVFALRGLPDARRASTEKRSASAR